MIARASSQHGGANIIVAYVVRSLNLENAELLLTYP